MSDRGIDLFDFLRRVSNNPYNKPEEANLWEKGVSQITQLPVGVALKIHSSKAEVVRLQKVVGFCVDQGISPWDPSTDKDSYDAADEVAIPEGDWSREGYPDAGKWWIDTGMASLKPEETPTHGSTHVAVLATLSDDSLVVVDPHMGQFLGCPLFWFSRKDEMFSWNPDSGKYE
eukprot:CAMPEP_0174260222 /NCGR_PEP_ID=MMETSP0439-20130205/9294_1 /TAXON_ID=0 /ORGANISM="Stereomyxa ramosa, Strain Chinc5" /LENGTH=173 /DNA_ID=CAMNT_0015344421 /DNA_START=23 /DNA_END=544 /DNA_ORIENTATION=+